MGASAFLNGQIFLTPGRKAAAQVKRLFETKPPEVTRGRTGGHSGIAVRDDRFVLESLNGFGALHNGGTREMAGVRDMPGVVGFLGADIEQ